MTFVTPEDLTEAEHALWKAFPRGEPVDLSVGDAETDDPAHGDRWGTERTIRAEVIAALLLGAQQPEPGHIAAVRLTGARIDGQLNLGYAEIPYPVRLRSCYVPSPVDLYGARTRQLNLGGSWLAGLDAALAAVEGNLRLIRCHCVGQIRLTGTHIAGALLLQGARLANPDGVALLANRLTVDDDVLCYGVSAEGELRFAGGNIGGMFGLNGARVENPGGRALAAFNLTVGFQLWARRGFTAIGEVALGDANIGREVDFSGACLRNPGGVALGCRGTQARELVLQTTTPIDGLVDLRHARFEIIRDDPATWPAELRLDGLSYDSLDPRLAADRRLAWLHRDVDGSPPQTYEQLAATYRRLGNDADTRTVLLAKQRGQRRRLGWYARVWGWLQDITVGYGYRPLRAGGWLAALMLLGTIVFGVHHPPPSWDVDAPAFNPLIYSLDLLLPIVDFGLEDAYDPQGAQLWLAYVLIASGWILATTIAAGVTRALRRE